VNAPVTACRAVPGGDPQPRPSGAQAVFLPDGRLHLNEGPIDLILQGWGEPRAVQDGYRRAAARFQGLLAALAAELPQLRSATPAAVTGPVAQAMAAAVAPYRPAFITPMAAVAGAVADAVMSAFAGAGTDRAYVNNGGDIALYLTPGTRLVAAVAGTDVNVAITADCPVRGIATSGWGGRSFSLGIADAVTVLAATAAKADAAATIVANAVDLPGHRGISRSPACALKVDSDLGHRLVTTGVGPLTPAERATALEAGLDCARALIDRGLIAGAALFLQTEMRFAGPIPHMLETAIDA
jgi:hypothetical protein